ncbi:MAG TPA: serine/threonine-protein kinase [Polyangiaceae bacterium]|nr:serine/threonine-protein kinase [Polyangiaceae bacterium]
MSRMPPHLESNDAGNTDLLVGRTIGEKFALEAILGAGAMGAVYRARQIALEKTVAVKVMHRGLLADPTFATRFHREAKAASRLDHPHSIRILDFGEEPDGLLYIVMDYLDGRDLLRVIQEDWPLPAWRTAEIVSQTLSALAVAHDMGVLHRDLKPENIMVLRHVNDDGSPADVVKVLDFGIAKIIDSRDSDLPPVSSTHAKLSTGGMLVGTPAYMSPEQAQGEPLDARSDLYSVGVIIYQILTMCLPFEAASAVGLLLKHVHEKPPSPSSVSSAVHPGLEAVCLKAMSKQRKDRYPNAREMRAALRAAMGDTRPSGHERYEALSPSPQIVHVGPRPTGSRPNADTATLPSIPSLPPSDAPLAPTAAPPRMARPWMIGAALVIASSAFFLPRLRHAPPVAPSQGLVSPTPPTPTPLATAVAPMAQPAQPETTAAPSDLQHRAPPVTATASTSLRKGTKGKASPADLAPENAAPAAVNTPPEERPLAAQPAASPAPPPPAVVEAPAVAAPLPAEAPGVPPSPPPAAALAPLNPALARVEIGAATSTTGTTASNVNKTIAPLAQKLTACYRSALSHQSQATDEGGVLHVETNEDGVIMDARLEGSLAAGAGRCIVAAVRGRRISNVDTGSATADVPLSFKIR